MLGQLDPIGLAEFQRLLDDDNSTGAAEATQEAADRR